MIIWEMVLQRTKTDNVIDLESSINEFLFSVDINTIAGLIVYSNTIY